MTLFWYLMVALVLGGLLVSLVLVSLVLECLWYQETRRRFWFRVIRVPALAPAPVRTGIFVKSAQPQIPFGLRLFTLRPRQHRANNRYRASPQRRWDP